MCVSRIVPTTFHLVGIRFAELQRLGDSSQIIFKRIGVERSISAIRTQRFCAVGQIGNGEWGILRLVPAIDSRSQPSPFTEPTPRIKARAKVLKRAKRKT
ncbi:hypothetical protein I7I53_10597 [Histoplasma capsulatum var. duboisii H88]|uniref:Uncharacterized protein n=1 Tax=Ajellomyces capsulatus (strain H88) TaxID=544711 RepID=A0A8A1L7V1_AJEC8|nr:hypothetical protein I7I53_10597 [Histoplasma capsulatum var. duboisii H88]